MCHHKHMARANASIVQLCLYVSFAFKNDDVNDVLFLCAVTFTTGLSVTVHRVEEERTTIEQPEPVHSGKCASHNYQRRLAASIEYNMTSTALSRLSTSDRPGPPAVNQLVDDGNVTNPYIMPRWWPNQTHLSAWYAPDSNTLPYTGPGDRERESAGCVGAGGGEIGSTTTPRSHIRSHIALSGCAIKLNGRRDRRGGGGGSSASVN